jgi:hypothetical protein
VLASSLRVLDPKRFRSACPVPGIGVDCIALSGSGVRQKLIVSNRPTGHEIEANAMFDRLDGRRVGFDVMRIEIVLICYGSGRQRQRRKL